MKQWITRLSTGNGFYLDQLQGGAFEPRKFPDLTSILRDLSQTTPEAMQALPVVTCIPTRRGRSKCCPKNIDGQDNWRFSITVNGTPRFQLSPRAPIPASGPHSGRMKDEEKWQAIGMRIAGAGSRRGTCPSTPTRTS
jgi:hypothetical protein